ncbi:MAG: hypothetical protein B7Z16_05040 [Algoriphagus sp. 32-45-6]|nr:MAG: hypothetical protein B7Z16_05040 [Algoriphagus sp. 32-45-6]
MEQEVIVQISNKIKSVRKDRGLTLQEVADRASVTKGHQRFEKETASGYEYFRIFTKKINACTIDIVLLEIHPGAERDFVQTEAFEYKYMISGRVKYQFRDQEIELNEGDSMLFDGRIEHNPINLGEMPAKMLVVYFFEVG